MYHPEERITLPPYPYVGSRFFCSRGIWWRVIAADGNNRLIMTEGGYNSGNWANRRTAVTNWAAENLAPELRAAMRAPGNVDFDENTISRPDGASTANDSVFILSRAEFTAYLGVTSLMEARFARVRPTAIPELRPGDYMQTHFDPTQLITSGDVRDWWLRERPTTAGWGVMALHGLPGSLSLTSVTCVRPVLWISI